MLAQLHDKYGEVPAFSATVTEHGAIVITVGPKGTWTMLARPDPDRVCLLSAGDAWAAAKPAEEKIAPQPNSLPTPARLPNGLLRI